MAAMDGAAAASPGTGERPQSRSVAGTRWAVGNAACLPAVGSLACEGATPGAHERAELSKDPHRRLASDARAGTFARRKARTDQRTYIKKHWKWLALGYVSCTGILLVPVLFEGNDFVRGLAVGLILAGAAGVLAAMVIIQTGTGPTMAGELAEQWTAQELRPMSKHGYRLANHVDVDGRGDADHVLVGPGGLFVLETKWSATEWTQEDRFFAAPLAQVQSKARNTWLQLKRHGVPTATPVLVLWGRAAKELSSSAGVRRNQDTYVIAGDQLKRWLLGRAPGVLTSEQVDAAYGAVCTLAERGDKVAAPVPPSVGRLYVRAVVAVVLVSTAFTIPLFAAGFGLPAYAVSAILLFGVGLLVRSRDRLAGLAVVTGACASLAIGAIAIAVASTT
jgi:hypothetical protein